MTKNVVVVLIVAVSILSNDLVGQWWPWQPPPPQQQRYRRREAPRPSTPRKRTSTKSSTKRTTTQDRKQTTQTASRVVIEESTGPLQSANPRSRTRRTGTAASATPAPRAAAAPVQPINRVRGASRVIIYDDSDSLSALSKYADTTANELLAMNRLTSGQLREGQALILPIANVMDLDAEEQIRAFDPSGQMAREIWRGIRGRRQVALTFDAGSEPDGGTDIVNHLRAANVKATFFLTGDFTRKYPDLVKAMADGGHPIYNHSWTHPEFTRIREDQMHDELDRTDAAIVELTGRSTKPYWRPPFGDRDRRVLEAVAGMGYQSIYWTIDSLDSVGETKSPDFIIDRVMNFPRSGGDPIGFLDGAIILMHIGKKQTADAVPRLIEELRAAGYEPVTIDTLLTP